MRCVTGHSTCASVPTWLSLTPIKHFITALTRVACTTLAAVVVRELCAAVCTPRVTRVGQTFVDVSLAAFAHVSRQACAVVPTNFVHTAALVKALGLLCDRVGKGCAVVDVDLAMNTLCSPWTGAFVGIDQVDACASVLAGLRKALIDLNGTVHSMITWHTFTRIVAQVVCTGGSILAGIGNAFIHLVFTIAARVSGLTVTVVCASSIQTLAGVTAQQCHLDSLLFGSHFTRYAGDVAVKTGPARLTLAAVPGATLPTGTSILTGRWFTPVYQLLAVETLVALWAGALVCAIAVLTGASVHTGSGVALVDVMLAVVASEALGA